MSEKTGVEEVETIHRGLRIEGASVCERHKGKASLGPDCLDQLSLRQGRIQRRYLADVINLIAEVHYRLSFASSKNVEVSFWIDYCHVPLHLEET